MRRGLFGLALLGLLVVPQEASAQLDPLLYLKRTKPNVLIAVDTGNRMQRDSNGDYRDDNVYRRFQGAWEAALGINDVNTANLYRRKFVAMINTDSSVSGDKFAADHIEIVGDREATYSTFDEYTRISIARRALIEAIKTNSNVARFGLLRMRQSAPQFVTPASPGATKWNINEGPVSITNPLYNAQQITGDWGNGTWKITRPVVGAVNGSIAGPVAPLVRPDSNIDSTVVGTSILNILNLPTGAAGSLLPAGRDQFAVIDAPVDNMLDDLKAEAARLIGIDTECRNTVAILVVGGGEGNTTGEDITSKANQFLNVALGHRVPIHVIALAPISVVDRASLQQVASKSGGKYTEIATTMVDAGTVGVNRFVPEFVNAVNFAISQAFAEQADFDLPPDASNPYGYGTSHQVTSPIVGTVNLEGAADINGNSLPDTLIKHPVTDTVIPQRSNILITTGFSLPGFGAKMQAIRTYKPVADDSKSVGYRFVSDGTKLWVASAPAAASRNIYTALPNGTMVAFTSANAATLAPYLKMSAAAAATLIDYVRAQPLGAIVDSTPAIMDPPSLDPPPDAD